MATITVNYRNHQPKTFQYSSILEDIEVNVKYKDSRGYCKGNANGEKFYFAWLGQEHENDKRYDHLFLEDWTNDNDGAPKEIKYSAHVIEALSRSFETNKNL